MADQKKSTVPEEPAAQGEKGNRSSGFFVFRVSSESVALR